MDVCVGSVDGATFRRKRRNITYKNEDVSLELL